MPTAKRATSEITLPPRTARVISEVDVLVVGGGPAGIGAAMGAAQSGSRVILAERYGFLGGSATAGLVLTLASYFTAPTVTGEEPVTTLFPKVSGAGKPMIAGILGDLVQRLICVGGALPPSGNTNFSVPFDPEAFKNVALEMLIEAGVELLFHALASSVVSEDNQVKGVVFETKSGPVLVQAKVVVDCTGDGDVSAFAGAPFTVGREEDGLVQPMSLMFLMSDFLRSKFNEYLKSHPAEWNGVQGLRALMQQAIDEDELDIPREDILFFKTIHEDQVSVNSTRITGALGIDVWDLTHAEIEGRRQIAQLTAFLRKHVPGFENAYLSQSGPQVCVRETRRILGEYVLTGEDVLKAHKFFDVIAHGTYPIDIHNPKGKGTVLRKVAGGAAYDIPLRCLIPQKTENLLIAGRCISGTHEALASYRVMPICMATGHAAGVCAVVALRKKQPPRKVTAREVQRELLRQGAHLEIADWHD